MKTLKIVGFVIGGLAAVAVLALAAALSSGVQTWAVRRAIANQPGMTIEVARVEAGFSSAHISGLRVTQPGLVAAIDSITARYSVWDYVTSRRINVDDLTLKDVVLNLRPEAQPAGAATPAGANSGQSAATPPAPATGKEAPQPPFAGLLKPARLPLDLRVAKITANGKASLPEQRQVVFAVTGSGIEAGQRGRIEWTVDFSDATPGAPLQALRSTGTLQVSLTADRRVHAADLDTIAAAMGPNLPPDQIQVAAKVAQPTDGGDEEYSVGLSLIRGGKTESLLTSRARFAGALREISGTWEIALRSEQLAALLAGFGLPEIAATGTGTFSLKPDSGTAAASGSLSATASQLQKLSPALAAVGSVQLQSTFDGAMADQSVHLTSFALDLTDGSGRRFAQINLLQKVSYRLADRRVTLADPKTEAARITLQSVPLAWAQPVVKPFVIDQGDLSLSLAVEAELDGSHIRARALQPLALRNVTVRDAGKKVLVDHVSLTLLPAFDYTPTQLSARLTDLKLAMTTGDSLSGTLSADVTNLATKPITVFRAQLEAKLVTLLQPFLAFDPGALTATVETAGRHEGTSLRLEKLGALVNRNGGTLLAAIDLAQPVQVDTKAATFAAANPAVTAARVRLGEIPLAWAESYVPKSKLAGTLTGATVEVTLRSVDDLTVNTSGPIALRGVSASLDGQALVEALDLTADFSATKRQDTIACDVRRLEVKQGATALAALTVAGEAHLGKKTTLTAKGTLEADAAALMKQPALVPFATLSRGRLTTAFEASIGDAIEAKVVLSAKDLIAKPGNRPLGEIGLALTASLQPDGSGSLNLPLTVTTAGGKSDLLINGTFGTAADKTTRLFNGKIASANLIVDDLQAFSSLAPASGPAPTTPPASAPASPRPTTVVAASPARPALDAAPFWQGISGHAEVDLKRVLYGKDYTIRAIRGAATIVPSRLALENLEGSFRDKPFKLSTAITFAAGQAQPYGLTGLVDISGFDVGEFLRAATPNEKPMLETTVKVAAKLKGSGRTLPELVERAYGTFDVSGSKGVLRALGRKGETVSTASTLLGLAGALTGSANTVSLGRLGQELEEMQFDSIILKVERDAALNMKFTSIDFLSPTKRLSGTGTVNYVANSSFENWPFQFEFKLAGKDYMANLLNEARVLSGQQDDKGYYPMAASFPVKGTAANVSNGLWKILAGSAVSAGLEGLLRR